MRDVRATNLAGRQFNRISRSQLSALGLSRATIEQRVASGRYVIVEEGVIAIAPVLDHDDWGRWSGATLTSAGSVLSRKSAGAAWGFWGLRRRLETVTRTGNGGPRRHGNVLVYRSCTLAGECTELRGIPITCVPRTLLDLASVVSERALARCVREAVRLELTTVAEIVGALAAHRRMRGARRLAGVLARYSGLPIHRARSGAEVRALEILRDAGIRLPALSVRVAGEEADLSWKREGLIIEIDGGPFHMDKGEDQRKQQAWERAGWLVRRIGADDVYERPAGLLDLVATSNVPQYMS